MTTPLAAPGQPHVGWTNPVTSYNMMKDIDRAAVELNVFVTTNVVREAFKASWALWYQQWKEFFEKYQGVTARLGALLNSDELHRRTLQYRTELETYRKGYEAERDAKGDPLPSPITPVPPAPLSPPAPEDKPLLPLWGWLLIGGAAVGLGYYLYKRGKSEYDILQARGRALEKGVAKMLPGPFGEAMGAASHDPNPAVTGKVALILNDTPIMKP